MKDLGIASKFLGMEIEYGKDESIKIHQNQYIRQLLERHGMDNSSPVSTPMDTSVKLAAINASNEAAASLRVCQYSGRSHVRGMCHQARYYVCRPSTVSIPQ